MDSQGIIYSELPLLFLTMDMAIIPRIYNVGISKDDSQSSRLIIKQYTSVSRLSTNYVHSSGWRIVISMNHYCNLGQCEPIARLDKCLIPLSVFVTGCLVPIYSTLSCHTYLLPLQQTYKHGYKMAISRLLQSKGSHHGST